MITETITRIKLTASDGMMLTNGEAFGKTVYAAQGGQDEWHEITEEQYSKILAEQEVHDEI